MNSLKKINPHILIICAFVTSLTACKSFDKDFIDNFEPNKRLVELKIDSLAKQKATFEWAMEKLNEEYAENGGSRYEYEYAANKIQYEYLLDEETRKKVEEFESRYHESSELVRKNPENYGSNFLELPELAIAKLQKYRAMMDEISNRLVLSPLKESSRGEDYIIYIIAFENNDVSTKMTIKVKFDVNKLYSEWQEI